MKLPDPKDYPDSINKYTRAMINYEVWKRRDTPITLPSKLMDPFTEESQMISRRKLLLHRLRTVNMRGLS